jgi:hypothetical protein
MGTYGLLVKGRKDKLALELPVPHGIACFAFYDIDTVIPVLPSLGDGSEKAVPVTLVKMEFRGPDGRKVYRIRLKDMFCFVTPGSHEPGNGGRRNDKQEGAAGIGKIIHAIVKSHPWIGTGSQDGIIKFII